MQQNTSHELNTLNLWREEGCRLIQQNNKAFRSFLSESKYLLDRGNYDAAAVYAQIAASHAHLNHSGFFVSPELEDILSIIGQKTIPTRSYTQKKTSQAKEKSRKILHVVTRFFLIGGSPRLMRRWIQQDHLNSHSIAFTQRSHSCHSRRSSNGNALRTKGNYKRCPSLQFTSN